MSESPLIEGRMWKLLFSGTVLAFAGVGLFFPSAVGRILGITAVAVQLGALVAISAAMIWVIFAVRCANCGLRLVIYAMSHNDVDKWLQWLLTVKKCPVCGQSELAGR